MDFFLAPQPHLNTLNLITVPSKTLSYKQSPLTHNRDIIQSRQEDGRMYTE